VKTPKAKAPKVKTSKIEGNIDIDTES